MPLPASIITLIAALAKLPGVGPRSAERIALYLVQADSVAVKQLAEIILQAREKIRFCEICGALTEQSPCAICSDDRRDASLVCVVERAVDILSIEKSGSYHGKYHVLGGKISPLDGVEPEDLRIVELEKRLAQEPIKEIVIALSTDVEGDATSAKLSPVVMRLWPSVSNPTPRIMALRFFFFGASDINSAYGSRLNRSSLTAFRVSGLQARR